MRNFLIFCLLLAVSGLFAAEQFPAQVVEIMADTQQIRVKGRGVFPIWGVNLPRESWMWGNIVKVALTQMLVNRGKVTCFPASRDIRGAARFVQHGNDVGLILLKMGLGWHDPQSWPGDDPMHAIYAQAEQMARKNRVGIWSEPNLVTPTGAAMVTPSAVGPITQKTPGRKQQARKKRR